MTTIFFLCGLTFADVSCLWFTNEQDCITAQHALYRPVYEHANCASGEVPHNAAPNVSPIPVARPVETIKERH